MVRREAVLCVDGVLVNDNKILLLRRRVNPFKGCWHLAGGHVETGESLKEALKREYKEETNLDIVVGDIIDYRIENTHDRTKIIVVLEVVHANGQIKVNDESDDFGWFCKTPLNSVCNYDSYLK